MVQSSARGPYVQLVAHAFDLHLEISALIGEIGGNSHRLRMAVLEEFGGCHYESPPCVYIYTLGRHVICVNGRIPLDSVAGGHLGASDKRADLPVRWGEVGHTANSSVTGPSGLQRRSFASVLASTKRLGRTRARAS